MELTKQNKYYKGVFQLYTDQLIGKRLMTMFNEYLQSAEHLNKDKALNKMYKALIDYSLNNHLSPNEKYGIAMLIRYANEINETNEKSVINESF